jgi:hypothetical protein
MLPSDDAPLRDHLRVARHQMQAAAAEAARARGVQVRGWAVRRLRAGWAATRRHRPSVAAGAALIAAGLIYAANERVYAAFVGATLAGPAAPWTYLAVYHLRRRSAKVRGDGDEFEVRRVGRKARTEARHITAAVMGYGGWLLLTAVLGVGAASRWAAFALMVELVTGCLLVAAVCAGHWRRLSDEGRRLQGLAEQRAAVSEQAEPTDHNEPDAEPESEPQVVDERLPQPTILTRPTPAKTTADVGDDGRQAAIEGVFAAFGLDATITGALRGPAVTRYEAKLGGGVQVARVIKLTNDIALALGRPEVRIYCPVPGRSVVGIEVPNPVRDMVALADVLASPEMRAATYPLTVGLGKSVEGRYVVPNLADMPHLLIAGATGSGKSGGLNAVICSILLRATPDQVGMLLIDPKRVELTPYDGVPHLVTPVVTDPERAVAALEWLVAEMDRRYDLLQAGKVRNIGEFNRRAEATGATPMRQQEGEPNPVEAAIVRLGQLARAAGIHLVLATQRPSVDVVTGLIKANMPSRLAFATSSGTDSRVILDENGAERLLGQGDGLFRPMGVSTPLRVQGAWVGDADIAAVVEHWHRSGTPAQVVDLAEFAATRTPPAPVQPVSMSAADVVLTIVAANPGCSSQFIAEHEVWESRGGRLSQPQLSRAAGSLVDAGLVTRVKSGRSWVDYRATDAGVARAGGLGLECAAA